MKGYPRHFVKVIYATVLGLCASGLLLAPTTLDLRLDMSVPWRLPGGERTLIAALHVVLSYFMVILGGALWHVHMRVGWRRRMNLWAGGALLLALLVLSGTGVAIFYVGGELAACYVAVAHLLIGAGLPLLLMAHVSVARVGTRTRLRARASNLLPVER